MEPCHLLFNNLFSLCSCFLKCYSSINCCHLFATICAIILIFLVLFFSGTKTFYRKCKLDSSVAITAIISILVILLGIILYNPVTNNLPIKGITVCSYCKLSFYENFQNVSNGICKLINNKHSILKDPEISCIFPSGWQTDIDSVMKNEKLLELTCAESFNMLFKKLNEIKYHLLKDALDNKIDRESQQIITKLLILDQLILIASNKTISSCSGNCCEKFSQCSCSEKQSVQSLEYKSQSDQ